jgi:CelD/BcsL family acetyltransferase involved in cellulose biosynthesis
MNRVATTAVRALPRVEVINDTDGYLAVADEIDLLGRRCGAPLTARSAWTAASLDALPSSTPLVVLIRSDEGDLIAAAVLLVTPGADIEVVTSPGGPNHRAALMAVDPVAGAFLGAMVASALVARPRRARVSLGAFTPGDPAVMALAAALPETVTLHTDPIPVVVRESSLDIDDYLSKSIRRGIRRAIKRMDDEGRVLELTFTTDLAEIVALLPTLEDTCRRRDHVQGRASELDEETGIALWRRRCGRVLAQECVELAVLRIDGEFAAYVFGVMDGSAYRVLEGRLVSEYARYSPGRILEAAVLERVLNDKRFDSLDWMTSIASDRLLATNAADDVVVVLGDLNPGGRRQR